MTTLNAKKADASNAAEVKETEVNIAIASLYTSTKAITQAIAANVKTAKNVQQEYQLIACSIIQHLNAHKDIRIVRHFFATMPKSLRINSMYAFFEKFASITYPLDEAGKPMKDEDDRIVIDYNSEKPTNLAHALTFAWWKATEETAYKPFSLLEKLQAVATQAENKLKKGVSSEKGDNVTPEQVAALRAVILQFTPNALVNAA